MSTEHGPEREEYWEQLRIRERDWGGEISLLKRLEGDFGGWDGNSKLSYIFHDSSQPPPSPFKFLYLSGRPSPNALCVASQESGSTLFILTQHWQKPCFQGQCPLELLCNSDLIRDAMCIFPQPGYSQRRNFSLSEIIFVPIPWSSLFQFLSLESK